MALVKRRREDAPTEATAPNPGYLDATPAGQASGQRFVYAVETIRSTLVGDKVDHGKVEAALNARARQGWQLKSVVETEVKGRMGPGGTMGLMLVFERPV